MNTAYSILCVQLCRGSAKTKLVYDVTRRKSVGERILSEVISHAPSPNALCDFIAELI